MLTINISSRQNPIIKTWLDLKNNKGADTFLIEGQHLVEMAHAHGLLETYISVSPTNPYGVPHYQIHPSIAEKLSDLKTSPGIFGIAKKNNHSIDVTKAILFLDDINDPGNLGTILRSALAFDFLTVVASPNTVNFYNQKVIMAGQGAHFALTLMTMDFGQLLRQINPHHYPIIATSLQDATPLDTLPKTKQLVLVIGNEARGVKTEILSQATQKIMIPMTGKIDSLNAAVAASIVMQYHFSRQ